MAFKLLLMQTKSYLSNKNTAKTNKRTAYFYIRVLCFVNLKKTHAESEVFVPFIACSANCYSFANDRAFICICVVCFTLFHIPRATNQSVSNFMWFISSDNVFFIRIRLCTVCRCVCVFRSGCTRVWKFTLKTLRTPLRRCVKWVWTTTTAITIFIITPNVIQRKLL